MTMGMSQIHEQFLNDLKLPNVLYKFHFLEDTTTKHCHILIHLVDSRHYIVTYKDTVLWIDYYEQADGGLFRRKSDGLHCQVLSYDRILATLTMIEDASGRNIWPEWYQDIESEQELIKDRENGNLTLSVTLAKPIDFITVTYNLEEIKNDG